MERQQLLFCGEDCTVTVQLHLPEIELLYTHFFRLFICIVIFDRFLKHVGGGENVCKERMICKPEFVKILHLFWCA